MSVTIILFVTICIITNFKNFKDQYDKVGLVPFLLNVGFFLALVLTLTYSENFKFGWRQIERGLPLFLFPIVFLYFPPKLSKKQWQSVLGTFVLANLLFIIYLFYYLVNNASDFNVSNRDGLILFENLDGKGFLKQLKDLWNATFYEVLYYAKRNKESFLEIHKTYASQSILWSLVIVAFYSAKKRCAPFKKIIQLLVFLILLTVLVYLYSMMNLLVLVLLSPVLIYWILGPIKRRLWFAGGGLILVIGTFFMVAFGQTSASNSYEKYKQYENPTFIFLNIEKMFQKDERNSINECNIELLKKKPLFGHGVGDVQDILNLCYESFEGDVSKGPSIREQNLNSHNYYAFLGLAGGAFVFILFIAMIGFNVSVGVRKKDLIYLAFMLIVSMNLLAENTLGRAQGILFFAIFNGIFLAKNLSTVKNDR